jgi:hypothetical protein
MTYRLTKADFELPALLLTLSVVPTLGGVVRLMSVASDTAITPDNARFLHAPTAVIIHAISATLYCLLGAFQFSRGFRLRWPAWHRSAGKLLVLTGLMAGVTGVWMTAFYRIPPSLQGPILYGVRLTVGAAMVASILIGWSSILRRRVARHEAFMIRAYALGQGAGTQVIVLLPWMLTTGESGGLTRDLLMTLAWAINMVVAESIIRRKRQDARASTWSRTLRSSCAPSAAVRGAPRARHATKPSGRTSDAPDRPMP